MQRQKTVTRFLSFNLIISLFLHIPYLVISNSLDDLVATSYSVFVMCAQILTVYFVLSMFIKALGILPKVNAAVPSVMILVMGAYHSFMVINFFIYKLFKFHFNGLAWNVISTPEGIKSMNLPQSTFYILAAALLAMFAFQIILMRLSTRDNSFIDSILFDHYKKNARRRLLLLLFLGVVVTEKSIYAYGDIRNDISITKVGKFFPFYFPLLIRNDADALLGITRADVESLGAASRLNYPTGELSDKKMPESAEPAVNAESAVSSVPNSDAHREHVLSNPRMNILFLVLDSWRFDQLNADVSPFMYEFSRNNQVFNNHHSGGNGTRHGVFSLMYGLHSAYWHSFLNERRGPDYVNVLKKYDYKFSILSSTSLKSPEFRLTAFVDVVDAVADDFEAPQVWQKDKMLVSKFKDFTDNLEPSDLFFSFILFDSTHSGFSYPKEFEKFLPVTNKGTIAAAVTSNNVTPIFNKYRNSIFYVDSLVEELIEDLKAKGKLENTMIVITGDHGEEFYEAGHFGHHGAFTKYQTMVPMIVHLPGKAHKESSLLTSHQDVIPSLLAELGSNMPASSYSNGYNMFDNQTERDFVLSCSYYDCSIIHDQGHIIFGTQAHTMMRFELRDVDYNNLADRDAALRQHTGKIVDALGAVSRFLK